jgi:hypothetical protein
MTLHATGQYHVEVREYEFDTLCSLCNGWSRGCARSAMIGASAVLALPWLEPLRANAMVGAARRCQIEVDSTTLPTNHRTASAIRQEMLRIGRQRMARAGMRRAEQV